MTVNPAARRRSPRYRNLTIRDVAILIAATAFGLALARVSMVHNMWGRSSNSLLNALHLGTKLVSCVVLAWTLAYVPLRMIRPRPRFRRAIRQPGTAACYSVLIALAITVVLRYPFWVICYLQSNCYPQLFIVILFDNLALASSVISIWSFLLIGGAWRNAGDWVEQFGKLLGAYWIVSDILIQSLHVMLLLL